MKAAVAYKRSVLYVDCGSQNNIPACKLSADEKKLIKVIELTNSAGLEVLLEKAEQMKNSLIVVEGLFSLLKNEFGG